MVTMTREPPSKMERTMNLIEQYITENIPIEIWRAACVSSPEANEVCCMMLVAAGLMDMAGDVAVDMSTDNNEYVASCCAGAGQLKHSR
jgi:hypothetical protein